MRNEPAVQVNIRVNGQNLDKRQQRELGERLGKMARNCQVGDR